MMRHGILVPMLVLVLAGCSAGKQGGSIFSAIDTRGRTLALGQEESGSLTAADMLSSGGHRVQAWTLRTSLGEELQVDLRSDDFDAFLYVVGPGLNEGLGDDDGGSGFNSRVCFVPEQPGEYRVVASSLDAGTGAFTIAAAETNGSCGGAVRAAEIDDLTQFPLEGRSIAVGDESTGSLTDSDPTFLGSPTQAWAAQGSAGAPFSVDLISDDFDAFLTVLGPGLDEYVTNDDGAGRCDSRISLTFPESGEYRVIVSALGVGTGAYRLIARERPGPASPEFCDPPAEAGGLGDDDEYVEGSLEEVTVVGSLQLESTVTSSMNGDEGRFRDRPLQGWTLDGVAGSRVAITLTSDQFDSYLFFDGPGFSDPLSDDDSGGGLDSRICVELPETGAYRVFSGPLSSADAGSEYRLAATVGGAAELCGGDFEFSPGVIAAELANIATQGRTIEVNEEQTGALSGEENHPQSGRPIQPWTLRGAPGTFLYVDVVSDVFDAYLYAVVEGLDGVLTADDYGDGCNARMELTIPASGEVRLLPSSFGATARGSFLLRVSTNPPPIEPGGCDSTGNGGSLADSGELDGLGLPVGDLPSGTEVSGVLGEGDDLIPRGFAQGFTFEGNAGQDMVFELVSDDFDCYLYLTGPGLPGVLFDDDGGAGDLDSRIEVTLPESGPYTVVVSAVSENSTGAFRLRAFRVIP